MDYNNIQKANAKILNVFQDRLDYNMAMKYINAKYAYKIMEMNQKEFTPSFEIKYESTPITSVAMKNDNENIIKVKRKPRKRRHPFIDYD